jgi:hypothetical protein
MININLKCQKYIAKKNYNFNHYTTWFLTPFNVFVSITPHSHVVTDSLKFSNLKYNLIFLIKKFNDV